MGRATAGAIVAGALGLVSMAAPCVAAAASLAPHAGVSAPGFAVDTAEVRPRGGVWRASLWNDLARTPLNPGPYDLRVTVAADRDGLALQVPFCAGRRGIAVDGATLAAADGPVVTPLARGPHEVTLQLDVSRYERRIACGQPFLVGAAIITGEGFGALTFDSPATQRGGGRAIVYVPPGHDIRAASALLVGTHPWSGSIWTYAAYEELVREATARDVVLLMPSGLGNSLYTADAEDEVLRAIDELKVAVAVDPRRVSIWGASMGGAGATTIGFHHPDRFATVTSFFGDSRYDLATYVRAILADGRAAHLVNALDVVDNARNLPVWLVHGEDDATSPIAQSVLLADALRARGFAVRFDRVPGVGHAGALVARFLAQVVDAAADARVLDRPAHVTYASVRPSDLGAYGVRIARTSSFGDAFVDVERSSDGHVHVLRAEGVRSIRFAPDAFGARVDGPPPPIDVEAGRAVDVRWDPP